MALGNLLQIIHKRNPNDKNKETIFCPKLILAIHSCMWPFLAMPTLPVIPLSFFFFFFFSQSSSSSSSQPFGRSRRGFFFSLTHSRPRPGNGGAMHPSYVLELGICLWVLYKSVGLVAPVAPVAPVYAPSKGPLPNRTRNPPPNNRTRQPSKKLVPRKHHHYRPNTHQNQIHQR